MGFFPPDYKKASGAEETGSGPNPKYFEFSKKYLGPGETASCLLYTSDAADE